VSVAFVLGGGGHLGAAEVGMLRALLKHGVRPDLIVGTSVGALHGATVARNPSVASVEKRAAVRRRRPSSSVPARHEGKSGRAAGCCSSRPLLASNP
jgi:predicted acylesterase/phospholipase RssA